MIVCLPAATIYNSRNYSILLNIFNLPFEGKIYNSRNYSILLNGFIDVYIIISTTVEIILYYLTDGWGVTKEISTTVEIILYYLT